MNIIFLLLIIAANLVFLQGCSSQPTERKPFMIVGKAEGPSNIYTALNIGFNLGNSNFDNNRLNTKYDSFSNTDIYSNLYSIYHSPIGSFRLGDKYVFTWYQHIRYSDDNKTILEKESFMSRDHIPYLSYSKVLHCPNKYSCFVLEGSYLPRIRKSLNRFSSINQISNRVLYGNGAEIHLTAYTGLISVGLNYQKQNFGDELKIQSISFNASFYVPLL